MSKTNNFVFWALYVIAWLIFIGLSIEAGGLITNFVFSIYKPEIVPNLYQKLDLTAMYTNNRVIFFIVYGFILLISIGKATMFYKVINLMHRMDLKNPFSDFVARQILQISYFTLSIGLLTYIGRRVTGKLAYYDPAAGNLNQFWTDGQAFIVMGAVIYIIATIFKKGVEIQKENDLTI